MINTLKKYHPSKKQCLLFLIIPVFFGLISSLYFNQDIWFLLNLGKYIVNHGIPHVETFTIHEGLSFISQQWLSSVIFYKVFKLFGEVGIYVLVNLVFLYIIFIFYQLCMLVSGKKVTLSVLITSLTMSIFAFLFLTCRPQIFSFAILLTEIYFLESYFIKNDKKYLYILPILSILLINLHASIWLMFFVFLVPYLLSCFNFKLGNIYQDKKNIKLLVIFTIISFLVGFINPYFYKSITYLFNSYGVPIINELVGEMHVVNINELHGKIFIGYMFLIYLIYMIFPKNKIPLRYFFLLIGTTYLGLTSYKAYGFFLIGGVFPTSYFLKNFFLEKEEAKINYFPYIISYLIILFLFAFFVPKNTYSSLKEGIDYLNDNYQNDKIRLYIGYSYGSYSEFLGIKSYIDSRAEVFLKSNNHKEDILYEYYSVKKGMIDYDKFLNKYDFTHLIVLKNEPFDFYLRKDKRYNVIYKGNSDIDYLIYEKE